MKSEFPQPSRTTGAAMLAGWAAKGWRVWRRLRSVAVQRSVACATIVALGIATSMLPAVLNVRERVLDSILSSTTVSPSTDRVVVVDIDYETLKAIGPWPWARDRLAGIINAIADAGPSVLGIDILLIGDDERSAGALARQLAASVSDAQTVRLAESISALLPDADQALATAIKRMPTVLGLAIDVEPQPFTPPAVAVLGRGTIDLSAFGAAENTIQLHPVGSIKKIADAARGHGVLFLPGDADARIRRTPLMLATRSSLRPGFALDVARLDQAVGSYLLQASPLAIGIGSARLPLAADGTLRLRPVAPAVHVARTISAGALQTSAAARDRLAGRIVLLGSSAPELGGLRPAASGELIASVQLQADAIAQIIRGDAPVRRPALLWIEIAAALIAAGMAIWLASALGPLLAGALTLALVGLWGGLSYALIRAGVLIDPLLVPCVTGAAFAVAALKTATETRWREMRLRRRFEQHLAPEVVQRIVENPNMLKLTGEARDITALFTDIEGFTALTERAGPTDLIRILDRYVEGASRIVVEHGGMVEKIVGDGLHVIFNAPLDLADHPQRAFDCALALSAFSEQLRLEPEAQRLGLGRTRLGLETGPVVVGDVGGGRRLDYTAHGDAMNRAARLEAANKLLGTKICVGPRAAAAFALGDLRPLGAIALAGVNDALEVFTVWPADADRHVRTEHAEAVAQLAHSPAHAVERLTKLAHARPDDTALQALLRRASMRSSD